MAPAILRAVAVFAYILPGGLPLSAPATDIVPPSTPAPAEEISLASLGLPAQTVHGSTTSIAVGFPAPAAALASAGNYARVFFGHSQMAGPGSNLQMFVNGEAVVSVPLTDSTSEGSVFVVLVPVSALHTDRPNVVDFQFSMMSTVSGAGPYLFARIDAQTALHYELAAEAGAIEGYPYSLLAGSLAGSLAGASLGLVLPNAPGDGELATAFRLIADASRLLRPAQLKLRVVATDQQRWLESAGSPALLVGRFDDLPSSAAVLGAAGFVRAPDGRWMQPRPPAVASLDDGLIAAALSPWDHSSPIILVTGATDLAVAKAGEALLHSRELGVSGHTAVVSRIALPRPAEFRSVALSSLLPEDVSVQGAGEHRITFGIPAPAVDTSLPARLRLSLTMVPSSSPPLGAGSLAIEINGHAAAARSMAEETALSGAAGLDLTGKFRAGVNGVALNLSLRDGSTQVRLDIAHAVLDLPPEPNSFAGLDQLPYPFLGDAQVANSGLVLANVDASTLEGAASAAAGLGSRAIVQPANLIVAVLGRDQGVPVAAETLIVIGGPADKPLQLRGSAVDAAVISPPAGVASAGFGWIEQLDLPGGGWALWVGGDPAMLGRTGLALGNSDLRGQLALVGPDGILRHGPSPQQVSPGISHAIALIRLVPAVVLGLLLVLFALQVRRSRRSPA